MSIGGIFVKWAHIAGYSCATGVLHEENVFADRKPHHPIHFPPQGVINGHLELRWESQSGYRSQQASHSKPTRMHGKTLDDPSPHVVYRSWSSPAFTGPK